MASFPPASPKRAHTLPIRQQGSDPLFWSYRPLVLVEDFEDLC